MERKARERRAGSTGRRTGPGAAAEARTWAPRAAYGARAATNLDLLQAELLRMAADGPEPGLGSALEALAGDVARGTPVAGMLAGLASAFASSRQGEALRRLAADAERLEDRR